LFPIAEIVLVIGSIVLPRRKALLASGILVLLSAPLIVVILQATDI
jgi:hypothetical protein